MQSAPLAFAIHGRDLSYDTGANAEGDDMAATITDDNIASTEKEWVLVDRSGHESER